MTLILDATDGVQCKAGIPVGSLMYPVDELIFIYDLAGADFEIPIGVFFEFVEAFLFDAPCETVFEAKDIGISCRQVVETDCVKIIGEKAASVSIPFDDYTVMVKYILGCSDLMADDPRLKFLSRISVRNRLLTPGETQKKLYEWLSKVEKKPGWNSIFGRHSSRLGVE